MNCKRCQRPLRSTTETLADYPGTLKSKGRCLCTSCHRDAVAEGILDDYPVTPTGPQDVDTWTTQPCWGNCGKTVRRSRLKAADYPGTVMDQGGRRCYQCRQEQFHNGQARAADEQRTTEENRASVESWLASHWRPSKTVKVVRL